MRAARVEAYGGPDRVVIREIPDPEARAGQLVVDIEAAALNFPDVLTIADKYQISTALPFTPGSEFAGRVSAVGENVTAFRVGDRVMGSTGAGAFAEKICVPEDAVSAIPDGLDMVHAAGFRVTYLTAYHSLVTVGDVASGDWVVVLGAAGGVGTATVDLAARLGARVIAAASTAERVQTCLDLGAHEGIAYDEEDLKSRIKEITGRGADLVVDPVGGRYAEQALRAIRWGGTFVTVGFAAGEIPRIPLNLVLLKNVLVRGVELRTMGIHRPDATRQATRAMSDLVAQGMAPLVTDVFTLDDVSKALGLVAERKATGKVVIEMRAT
ncbi:zinc-binding dehydrogenase [Aeromicrobium sp. SMF47]|uniref:NADPH:quinone oxidoreductase family protein n=1 Tax=Aeromicrobium yanjiei TaxID=2662028 RepID=UPI00129E7885|nr:NADPH:quinone oxidoreductase family protein [Aeromicrobium yanjiei]MRJ77318.1 zinc-binding dehydrogenase [Aeromicrobium yanjiei]